MAPPPINFRNLQLFGGALVKVRGGLFGALDRIVGINPDQNSLESPVLELGITDEPPLLVPEFNHQDLIVDDFGISPPETLWNGSIVRLWMKLAHYDPNVLDACLAESMAGSWEEIAPQNIFNGPALTAGTFAPVGTPMGGYSPLYSSGCHYITVWLIPSNPDVLPYRFPACYLTGPPLELPVGTDRSIATCNWKAIPYVIPPFDTASQKFYLSGQAPTLGIKNFELISSGAILWDRTSG